MGACHGVIKYLGEVVDCIMGLDFSKAAVQPQQAVPDAKNEIEVVQQYDIMADRQQMNSELTNSAEVDATF